MGVNKNCFDFIRFILAFNILTAHLCELSQSEIFKPALNYLDSGWSVKGFFVISGFLVAKSYQTTPSLKEYFIKRAKRILPAYIFVVSFVAVAAVAFSRLAFSEYFSSPDVYKYLGWNYIFLNFIHPCLPGVFESNLDCGVNGALWTLKVEESFYVVLPLIFYFIRKTRKPLMILAGLYLFSVVYWYVMEYQLHKYVLAKQMPGYLSYFSVGILLFMNFEFLFKHKLKVFFISIALLVISYFSTLPIDLFYPAAFGTLMILAAYSIPYLNNFGKYGDFTYGMYIYHYPIIQVFRQYNLFEKYNPFLMASMVVLLTFVFAVFSWFVIEKRFLDRFKKQLQKETTPISA